MLYPKGEADRGGCGDACGHIPDRRLVLGCDADRGLRGTAGRGELRGEICRPLRASGHDLLVTGKAAA
jgi:hypothetical protein